MNPFVGPAILSTFLPSVLLLPFGGHDLTKAPSPARAAAEVYAAMTQSQRVGQLLMIGVETTKVTAADIHHLQASDVGNIILNGNSHHGVAAIAKTTKRLDSAFTVRGAAPFVATDQEGGEVQRLTGSGFTTMPSALAQGKQSSAALTSASKKWGKQLAKAGVNLDLAPVADTVPAKNARNNQPIGKFDREFGHTTSVVKTHVAAFVRGMSGGGVDVTVKHFPGLGRATGNTDLTKHVTDPTTKSDPYLKPFQSGINAGAQFVMVSLATYPHIDASQPACFSSTIMKTMLRKQLGFTGVVISDSMNAVAVSGASASRQALRFFQAGGTMLLNVDPAQVSSMRKAVLARMTASPAFAQTIKADVLKVLQTKAKRGLLPGAS
jgi:beta-N-acetylhexosaminidase